MQEEFLHYLWVNKKLPFTQLKTQHNEDLEINHFGQFLQNAGPDIFNAQIVINQQKWAGNIEIHIKSSDWYAHHHEKDSNYDNIILHVVWEYDAPIFRRDNSEIPTLELRNYVSPIETKAYKSLLTKKTWINCENQIATVDSFIWKNWLESLFINRLERKAAQNETRLQQTNSDWEAVFFELLAKNFGLNTNGSCFLQLAQSIPYAIIRKERSNAKYLEALFFGKLNLLEEDLDDTYYLELQANWEFLKIKYHIHEEFGLQPQFFKLRPDNFPTIRLSQLVQLLVKIPNLCTLVLQANTYAEMKQVLKSETSEYWRSHYNFSKSSPTKIKVLSNSFIDLLLINTVLPFKFCYDSHQGKSNAEQLMKLLEDIPPENNTVLDKFSEFKVTVSNAFESQSLLELKNEYCVKNKCLNCAVGLQLLKN